MHHTAAPCRGFAWSKSAALLEPLGNLRHLGIIPGVFGKIYVPVRLRNRSESATRGLRCGARIGRGAVSSRLTGPPGPPVPSPLCTECTLAPLKEASSPHASWQVGGS